MTRIGTSYFITFERACRYYQTYSPGASRETIQRWVARKIAEGEIHIGEPPIKGNKYLQLDRDGRYEVVSP